MRHAFRLLQSVTYSPQDRVVPEHPVHSIILMWGRRSKSKAEEPDPHDDDRVVTRTDPIEVLEVM